MNIRPKIVKKSELKKAFLKRDLNSHKGKNGRVMIVGGSLEYYGAPLLSALGAIYSGADLIYLFVPSCNFDVTRSLYPDFIVRQFEGDYLQPEHVSNINEFAKNCDVLLMGPGVGEKEASITAMSQIIQSSRVPLVLDAAAIFALAKTAAASYSVPLVITPHQREFERFTGKQLNPFERFEDAAIVRSIATDFQINIMLKGPTDTIVSDKGESSFNQTGNAGMTVGGSGDILSGAIASLIAQGCEPYYACELASYALGATGDQLMRQKGHFFSATDLALELPFTLNSIVM